MIIKRTIRARTWSHDTKKTMNFDIVNIKWGKQTFKDVEVDTGEDAVTFKACLYGLTNVPVDK